MEELKTTTPTSKPAYETPFKKRFVDGSYKKARRRGKVRGIVVRPEQMLDLLRDSYHNAPVPPDAQFFAVGVDDRANLIQFYFYSLVSPNVNCVQCSPQLLLDIITATARGVIPKDADLVGICVHHSLTLMRLDVTSDKFPALNVSQLPLIQLRYEGNELLLGNPSDQRMDYRKDPMPII